MLLPITLICKKAKARRDGTGVIKIQYCYTSDKRKELDTEIPTPPKYWKNTTRLYVNFLRCFLNNRMRKGITGPMDLSTLKAPGEEVDAIYLDWQEISQIYHADLSKYPQLANSRDTLGVS